VKEKVPRSLPWMAKATGGIEVPPGGGPWVSGSYYDAPDQAQPAERDGFFRTVDNRHN